MSIVLAGDLVLDEPDGESWLAGIAPALRAADLAIGHLEVPHTRRGVELRGDVPAPGAPPENIAAIANSGFAVVSLAGNHICDCGAEGIADTICELERHAIAHTGAGATLDAARRPAVVDCRGRQIALLSYNCVGPQAGWATEGRAGCAFLPIATSDGSPVTPTAPLVRVTDEALDILREDCARACQSADFLIVALHKGLVHTPARLAPYERSLAYAAIDAGADAVISHHAHIVRGIEFHNGRPIFHGLGNGCVVTRALSPAQDHPARRAWAERRKALFGFEPDPAYTLAPFHPEAVNTFLGRIDWDGEGLPRAGIIPVHVEAPGKPVLANQQRGREIADYVQEITIAAGLPAVTIDKSYRITGAAA